MTSMQWRAARPSRLVAALCCLWGCENGVIAPLPSPDQPDDGRIITSSLSVADDDPSDVLVAVVGFDGAVSDTSSVEVTNARTGRTVVVSSSAAGSFSAAAYGRANDALEVRQLDGEGRRSLPVTLTVAAFEQTNNGVTAAPEGSPSPPSFQDTDSAGAEEPKRLDVVWQFVEGVLSLDANAGFTSPGDMVVLANTRSGLVVAASADSTGAVRLELGAEAGDEMVLFNRATNNPSLTSPAVRFFVPAAGGTGGTDT